MSRSSVFFLGSPVENSLVVAAPTPGLTASSSTAPVSSTASITTQKKKSQSHAYGKSPLVHQSKSPRQNHNHKPIKNRVSSIYHNQQNKITITRLQKFGSRPSIKITQTKSQSQAYKKSGLVHQSQSTRQNHNHTPTKNRVSSINHNLSDKIKVTRYRPRP